MRGRRVHGAGLLRDGSGRVSAACGCDEPTMTSVGEAEEVARPWWRDRGILMPVFSGVAFLAGLIT